MKKQLCLALLMVSIMFGCTYTMRLYPVQGPLSAQRPLPVFVGKLSVGSTSGDISVVLGNGELCKGRWAQVPRPQPSKPGTTAAATTANDMTAIWDTVYGQGFYVSHVLGTRLYAQALLSGNQGTVMNVEMYQPEREHAEDIAASIKGVAKDNKDNIYKITF